MNRVSTVIVLALFTVAAIEFGLLGASAAGLTGSDRDLPPIAQRGVIPPTNTPTPVPTRTMLAFVTVTPTPTPTPMFSPPNVSPPPPSSDLTGTFIQADPLTIVCNGGDTSWITARLFQSNGEPAPDGTWAYFNVDNGYADPYAVQTSGGYANTQVRLYGDGYYFGPNVVVSSGLLEAGIKVLCRPDSNNRCPISPPDAVSPPCATATPTPFGTECRLSPPAVSPPCGSLTPFPSATPQPMVRLEVDCNPTAVGIQDECAIGSDALNHTADVVLSNDGPADIELFAFNFEVDTASFGRLVPPEISQGNVDDNPDFNQSSLGINWVCSPPEPVADLGTGAAGHTVSLLSCFNTTLVGGHVVTSGGSVVLGSVDYLVAAGEARDAFIDVANAALYGGGYTEIGSCNPTINHSAQCIGAALAIALGDSQPPIPTPTATSAPPPIPTPIPQVLGDIAIAVDCDLGASGVQSDCDVALDATSFDVGIVLQNLNSDRRQVAAFNFLLRTADISKLLPIPGVDANLDANPDFAISPTNNWTCVPPGPSPDTGRGGPGAATSFMSCYDAGEPFPTFLEPNGELLLAVLHYTVPVEASAGDVELAFLDVLIVDALVSEIGSCGGSDVSPVPCDGATVNLVGDGGGPVATSTQAPVQTATRVIPVDLCLPIPQDHCSTPTPVATATATASLPPTAQTTSTPPPVTPTGVRTTPSSPARTPTAAFTPLPGRRCADVDGDGRVRLRDVRRIAEAAARRTYGERYDINRDGRLSARDVGAAVRQLGRRC